MQGCQKQMYLISGENDNSYESFSERINSEAMKLVEKQEIERVSYTFTPEKPPGLSVIPFKKSKIACMTVWKKGDKPESLVNLPGCRGAYRVTEALPVSYKSDRPEGEITPGVCLLTLFRSKKGIDYKTFIDRWHNSHTPMSLKYHPLWHYSRNVVDESLMSQTNGWQGIVEEHFRTRSELLNPFRFFGKPHVIIQRMINVYRDTKSFIDYQSMETYLVKEVRLKG